MVVLRQFIKLKNFCLILILRVVICVRKDREMIVVMYDWWVQKGIKKKIYLGIFELLLS